ncbi:glycerate kinase [Romeria aff. gracilis LEGE 07310]|uniref:Glycerate kinase n=1 Tax=Vasconcelosia minhoensis LEGE 07310 TaxID=915328 RepID=A0A8J7AS25_9CYAN|nr:glycerate kinase [Romeria aff. gracilis LEGE 07310]
MVRDWGRGLTPTAEQRQALLAWELADTRRARAWQITAENGLARIAERADLLQRCLQTPQLPLMSSAWQEQIPLLWSLWLPLARQIAIAQIRLKRPLIHGILGAQGTGKTTLAQILQRILAQLGQTAVCLSIDDFYKTYAEREQLRHCDPRLVWRGPPGTHDIGLAIQVLRQLRAAPTQPVMIPRFDKSLRAGAGDRVSDEPVVQASIVLFEGWCVGLRPIGEGAFDQPPSPIETAADRQFALEMNRRLADYLPLWSLLDQLTLLLPEDYRLSLWWRQLAEAAMRSEGRDGMSDADVRDFVHFFWRALHPQLFIPPLVQNGGVNLVIEVSSDRGLGAVYRP